MLHITEVLARREDPARPACSSVQGRKASAAALHKFRSAVKTIFFESLARWEPESIVLAALSQKVGKFIQQVCACACGRLELALKPKKLHSQSAAAVAKRKPARLSDWCAATSFIFLLG